ncbi:outer membrane beta-barrel family protein [Flammeovirga sp. SubArs3]|uniref:outer membrane beta-barrel family protein n=1 Tax=Flammeovirga sp. SubArs3 TaxID=2995316 RepID=UPI00248C80D1|nr:outer membrane beta-barrel family protein [Flammeovirga sp. SubArs3]
MLRNLLLLILLSYGTSLLAQSQKEHSGSSKPPSNNDRYEIGKNIKIIDGNAIDALKLIPAVDVDADGVVSYRGNTGVQIFINNRPASQSGEYGPILEQILIEDIEYIDIISNPSARYDADGTAGIINISTFSANLKSSSANILLGTGTNDKYDAGIGLNKQDGKLSLNLGYNYKQENRYTSMDANLKNFGEDEPFKNTDQQYYGDNNFEKHNLSLGGQYDFNEKNSLNVAANLVWVDWGRYGDLTTIETIDQGRPDSSSVYNTNVGQKFKVDGRLDYLHTTDREGEELAMSLAFAAGDVDVDKTMGTSEYNNTTATFNNFAFQTDYSRLLGNGLRLETGFKQTYRGKSQGLYVLDYDENTGGYIPNEDRNNIFNYNEHVTAGYAMVSGNKNKFSYQVGVRVEQTFIRSYLESDPSKVYENDYFKIYPSLNLKQGLGEYDNVFFSYSRKVQRPGMRMINPFEDTSNPSYIQQGNPELDATFLDIFEIGYAINKEKFNIKTSLFYKLYTDPARWYTTEENGVMINTVVNMEKSVDAGWEVVGDLTLNDWWSINGNLSIYYNMIDGTNVDESVYQTSYNWNAGLSSNMKLWKGSQFLLTYKYMSPSKNPQGDVKGRYFINASLSQSMMKGQGSLILSVDDVLDTQQYAMTRNQPTFSEDKLYDWESKVVRLTFRYRIGGGNKTTSKQKGSQEQLGGAIFN